MSEESTTTVIYNGPGFRIRSYGCEGGAFGAPIRTAANWHSILFIRRGMFLKSIDGQTFPVDANKVTLFNKGEPYAVQYPGPEGDRITELQVLPELIDDMAASLTCAVAGADSRPFVRPYMMIDSTMAQRHLSMWREANAEASCDGLEVQEKAFELAHGILHAAGFILERRGAEPTCDATLAHEVMSVLNARFRERITLDEVACEVASSAYHLCRVFRRATGQTVHGYLMDLRVREAMGRLLEGGGDLTRLALDHGFSSHSHFTKVFRERIGLPPSAWRAAVRN